MLMLAGDLRFIECVWALRFQAPSANTRLTEPWHQVEKMMTPTSITAGYELADFNSIPGVPCPCGTARRAFEDVADFPGTIHQTSISTDAQTHYHKRLTETYVFLECGPDAAMELDGERIPVRRGMSIMIRPGTRHRAVGEMQVLIVCLPKFDPADEWFD